MNWKKIIILILLLLIVSYFFGFFNSKEKFLAGADVSKCNEDTSTIEYIATRSTGGGGNYAVESRCKKYNGEFRSINRKPSCKNVKKYQMIDGVCKEISVTDIK